MRRFSDTSRFDEQWYCSMPVEMKAAWELLWAKADAAGVWSVNHKLADFQIGKKVDWEAFVAGTGGRLIKLSEARYLFTEFVKVNCGKLSRDCKAHNHVFEAIESNGLEVERILSGSYSIATPMDKEEEKETDKEPEKGTLEGVQGEPKALTQSEVFVAAWNGLPSPPFAHIRQMSGNRVEALRGRMKEEFWASNWKQALESLPSQPFARGEGRDGWTLDVDFFLKPGSVAKIIEGKYAHAGNGNHKTPNDANHNKIDPDRGW